MGVTRITGMNSGLDVDTIVKQSLSREQNKINKAYQNQKIYEYQQEQLKDIVSDAAGLYDKYLDRLSSTSLLSDKAYKIATFTGKDLNGNSTTKVTAKAYAGADITDYKVNINQIAKKASTVIRSDSSKIQSIANSGKGIIAVKMTDANGRVVNAGCNVVMDNGEIDMNATIKSLNSELKKNGLNVSAKYSEFSKGIVLESGTTGEKGSFDLAIVENDSIENHNQQGQQKLNEYLNTLTYEHYAGQNAKGMITKGDDTIPIDSQTNSVLIDNVEFSFKGITVTKTSNDDSTLVSSINDLTESGSNAKNVTIKKESHDGKVTLTIQNDEDGRKKSETIERKFGNITLKTNTIASTGAQTTSVSGNLTHLNKNSSGTSINTDSSTGVVTITKGDIDNGGKTTTVIDESNHKTTTTFTCKLENDQIMEVVTETIKNGGSETTTTRLNNASYLDTDKELLDNNNYKDQYKTIITSEDGKTQTTIIHSKDSAGSPILEKDTTKLNADGSTTEKITTTDSSDINFTNPLSIKATESEPITLSGETDIASLKDSIIKFVDEYNKVIQKINTKIWEKRDKDYMPLTEDQQKELKESQVEAWEKKAKTGLLRFDDDLQRIQNEMKNAMSSLMSGTGLTLKSIGIESVDSNTTKNGMYTVNESKLTEALENNSGEVKDLFTRKASDDGKDKGGVLTQLSSVLKSEVKSSKSSLAERIGFDGTQTATQNTLSKNIEKQKKLIKELKKQYTTRENALYKKYSALETTLQKLNEQSSSLYSMLGLN